QNPVGGPASVISAGGSFSEAGTLPTPDPSLVPQPSNIAKCSTCGSDLRSNAKFCTNCGNKT
ncbi:MAG: zinc-ribbon domain-containing protein, partial [Gammaproteobacteria bacterium]|nr:zinc-ribbon domain-containing protein [Gammaproteobacteria bacterium]